MHEAEEQEAAGGNVFPPLWSVDVKASGMMITDFNDHPSVGSDVVVVKPSRSIAALASINVFAILTLSSHSSGSVVVV